LSTGPLDGLLLVHKPPGPTSHDIVDRVRRGSGARRVGHAGTLDPPASGLLPLVLGRATRLVRYLPDSPKTYVGLLRLGRTTTTDDATGETVTEHAGPLPTPERVSAAAAGLVGRQAQVPPAYSARQIGGQRLYALARRGVVVAAPPAEIDVRRFDLAPTERPELWEFTAEVSCGTYVRALARDLGRALACGGSLESLVRSRIGPLRIEDAHALPEDGPDRAWVATRLIPLDELPLVLPAARLATEESARRFRLGTAVPGASGEVSGPVSVLAPNGCLLGVAEPRDGLLQPRVVLDR
jgi:tRNA pseudouridine55 synthase